MAKKASKSPAKKVAPQSKTRRLKQPRYHSFRPHKRIKHTTKLPGSFKLLSKSVKLMLISKWKLFGALALLYGLLTILLVRGIGGGLQLNEIKASLHGAFGGSFSSITTGLALFSYILGSAGSSQTETGGLYQAILMVIFSLAIIWGIRQTNAGQKIKMRDMFYKGMYPLIPFIVVLIIISLQLLPLLVGSWLYSVVVGNGIAATLLERVLWGSIFFLLSLLSLYMICSSLFALYIVTLPDMTPMKALRSARQLVLHRRWTVMRKIIFLPVCLLIVAGVIMMPFILFVTPLAVWVFFIMTTLVLIIIHGYMYALYRELL